MTIFPDSLGDKYGHMTQFCQWTVSGKDMCCILAESQKPLQHNLACSFPLVGGRKGKDFHGDLGNQVLEKRTQDGKDSVPLPLQRGKVLNQEYPEVRLLCEQEINFYCENVE